MVPALSIWLGLSLAGQAVALPPFLEKILTATGGVDGITTLEWNQMTILQRIKVYNFQMEYLVLATIAVYLVTHFLGVKQNQSMVDAWMDGARPVLQAEFAEVGCSAEREVIKDSNARFTTYASGRENIASLLARLHLVDRQNIVLRLMGVFIPNFRSMDGLTDQVDVEITPMDPSSIEPAIFAIADKNSLRELRDQKYYLSLCRTIESDKLPNNLCFLAEHKDIIDVLFTPELQRAVHESGDLIEYLAVTDQGSDAPEEIKDIVPRSRVVASLRYPATAAAKAKLGEVVQALVHLVDHQVTRKPLRLEVARKIKAAREEAILRIKRREEQARLEEIEAKKAEERRAADRAQDQLSEKEQRKLLKRQQEKEQRKLQKRQQRLR